ncbi:MAG: hypothetical protein QM734_16345 [Cyclobacteriaceae bacterium]
MKKLLRKCAASMLALALLVSCQKEKVQPVYINPMKDIQATWQGEDYHFYNDQYKGDFSVKLTIDSVKITINYIGDAPADRANPLVWKYKPSYDESDVLNLQISSTYKLAVTFSDINNVKILSNNGDETFQLRRK